VSLAAGEREELDALANRFFAAIEAVDATTLDALYTPDAVVWHNYDNVEQPRADNIAMLASFPRMFREFRYAQIRRQFFPGGFVQQHVCRGVKVGGESFAVPNCMVVSVRGGRICRIDDYFDSAQDGRPPSYR
jgi:ketosteroid isomerase-like protein